MKAIIPAIDISNGRCVRLSQGDFSTKKVYEQDPVDLAKQYVEWGARRMHIVDLDAAFRIGNNRAIIGEICKTCNKNCIVEVGGGIRDKDDVKALLDMGTDRLCVGTVLVRNTFEVMLWTQKYGNVFVGSVDVKDNNVQIAGWRQDGDINIDDFLKQIKKIPLRSIDYTNINVDGMLTGTDVPVALRIANISHVPLILSGGIGTPEDIDEFMKIKHDNIVGIIVGKALYEGLISLQDLFKKYPSPDCSGW